MQNEYTPEDDENTIYLPTLYTSDSMGDVMDAIFSKWGRDVDLHEISVRAEHIHTHCIGYDQYDPGDWTDYIVIEKRN